MIQDFLFYNQLNWADYYGVAAMGYLEAVQAYDEDSRTRQYKFETIVSRKMCDCLFKHWRYNGRLKRKACLVSLDGTVYEDSRLTLSETIEAKNVKCEDLVFQRLMIEEEMVHITEKEKKVVQMKAAGFSGREIGVACGVTTSGVYGRLYRMRKRLNRVFSAQESEAYAYT
ncbi:sigma-70 family RNA polymerase sigma factor [Enterocloster clostridioformis]|uniref:hypothetical protein n=1 Tax=Enterocloster clostridioformis TaxID=1531 RepID=UPI001F1DACAC|nr:hypothetical protein [Enterocloster clostridioformis]MCF2703237.1 sigma-70 family RNA polymerase sigma factor [Enterocloster clostridioformis]